ncbi:MAG: S-methyl-5'-thioadenosine phosphorylase [Myxococcales bacterium]|nr:S-methyl-5'-thioadenosine phosphorylase [Myxococcales bacterium]
MSKSVIGVIGGSGLYQIDGVDVVGEHVVHTPFGMPSDALIEAKIADTTLFFLPRHGRGHRYNPSEINYRANIWALRKVGCTDVLSVSAVGSMQPSIAPGHMVLPTQFIDRTVGRARTFFEDGIVAHVGFGDPISERVRSAALAACNKVGVTVHSGGTYVCIEGPQFSTRAESTLFRSWPDVKVIGMTNMPEARLAREAEMAYATIALVTDFDCWHEEEEDVTVESVVATMRKNVAAAKQVIVELAKAPPSAPCASHNALAHAVMTAPDAISAEARRRVALLMDKHW